MIILILSIFTILTFYGFMFIKNRFASILVGGISIIILAVSTLGLTLHMTNNWGMKEVTTTTKTPIYTAGETSASFGMLIKSEIGKSSGNYVFVYRQNKDDKNAKPHFVPDQKHIVNAVRKSATYKMVDSSTAQVVSTTTKREFSSNLMKMLFGIGDENNELVKQTNVVEVPKSSWIVLTADQAKELGTKMAAAQKEQQAAIQKQLAEVPAAARPAAEAQIKAKQEAAMSNPETMIAQIKEILNIK